MNVYIQQKYPNTEVFGDHLCDFKALSFDELPEIKDDNKTLKISDLITYNGQKKQLGSEDRTDTFQPIIDFSNFLLIVLKLTRDFAEEMCRMTFVSMYLSNVYSACLRTLCNKSHSLVGNPFLSLKRPDCIPFCALPGCAPIQQFLLSSSVNTQFRLPLLNVSR